MRYVFNRGPYLPRIPELKAISGKYESGIEISVRHKDILNCSKTRHFTSCYAPGKLNGHVPELMCYDAQFGIALKRDRSGQFLSRAFIQYSHDVYLDENKFIEGDKCPLTDKYFWEAHFTENSPIVSGLIIGRIYGNYGEFKSELVSILKGLNLPYRFSDSDFYLEGLLDYSLNPNAHNSRIV